MVPDHALEFLAPNGLLLWILHAVWISIWIRVSEVLHVIFSLPLCQAIPRDALTACTKR